MSSTAGNSGVVILYDEYEQEEGAKGIWDASIRTVKKMGVLDTSALAANLQELCKQMGQIFEGVTTAVKNYELKNVEIVVDITAKGEVKLLGSGVTGDMKGGIRLVFSRQNRETGS